MRTEQPKTTPVLAGTPMPRQWRAVSGFRPSWLGISPWGLIVFLLLGFAAGVLNVMRAAGVVSDKKI